MAVHMHDTLRGLEYFSSRLSCDIAQLLPPQVAGNAALASATPGAGASGASVAYPQGGATRGGNADTRAQTAASAAAQLAVLRVELARERTATKAARTSLRSKEQALEELAQAAAATQVMVVKLKEQLDEKETVVQQLGEKFVEVQQGSAAASVERDKLTAHLEGRDGEIRRLRAQVKEAKAETSAANTRIADLQKKLRASEKAAAKAAAEVIEASTTTLGLKADISALKDKVARLKKSAASAAASSSQQQTRALADMARKKDAELATLNAKLKVANRMAESSRGSQNALDSKLADARKEVAELRAELEAKEKAIVDARAEGMAEGERAMERKLKVEELQEQLKEMTEKFEAAENARLAGEADNEELRQEKEGQEGRLRAMELQVSHLKDVAKESANAARAAQETVANVTDDKLVLAKHIKQMQAKMSTLVREYKSTRKMRDAAVKEVTSLQASLRETEALLSQAETQVVQLRADAAETARRQGTLKATLHAVQEELRVTTAGFRVSTLNHQRAENQCMAFEDRRSRALEQHQREAAFRRTTGGWMKQLVLSPPPPVPLNDPVILGVLQNWTADQRKIAYVEKWMTDVVKGKIFDKKRGHSGLELSKLTKEVRDGFLMMILPLLKQRPDVHIQVWTRENVEVLTDLRVKISRDDGRRHAADSASPGSVGSDATFRTRDYDRVDADPIQAPSSSERRRRRTLPAQPVAAPGRDAVRRYSTQTPQGVGAGAGAGAGGDSAMNPRHAQLGRISTIAEGDHGSDGGRPGGAASGSDMAAALARRRQQRAAMASGAFSAGRGQTPTSVAGGGTPRSAASSGSSGSGSSRRGHTYTSRGGSASSFAPRSSSSRTRTPTADAAPTSRRRVQSVTAAALRQPVANGAAAQPPGKGRRRSLMTLFSSNGSK